MVSIPGLYFVIARGDKARFVRPDPENCLHTVGFVDLSTVGGSSGPDRIGFVALLAARICEDFAVDLFTHLVLVAPSPVLQELVSLFDAATAEGLFGMLARDLISVPDLELWPHFLPWMQPAAMDCAPGVPSHE